MSEVATALTGVKIWAEVHFPPLLILFYIAAVIAETALGHLKAALPFFVGFPLKWGFLLPLITAAVAASALYSGFAIFERHPSSTWRVARAGWFAGIGIVAILPGLWSDDMLEVSGSVRNRMMIFALTSLTSLIVPAALAVIPTSIVLFGSVLTAGALGTRNFYGSFLLPLASTQQWVVTVLVFFLSLVTYVFYYPPRWAYIRAVGDFH